MNDFIHELAPVSMPSPTPAFFAQVTGVHDGDTLRVFAWKWDDGYAIWPRVRLARINAPELATPAGKIAQAFVAAWVVSDPAVTWPFVVYTQARDNYGRPLVTLWRRSDGACLNDDLVASGNAVPYPAKVTP